MANLANVESASYKWATPGDWLLDKLMEAQTPDLVSMFRRMRPVLDDKMIKDIFMAEMVDDGYNHLLSPEILPHIRTFSIEDILEMSPMDDDLQGYLQDLVMEEIREKVSPTLFDAIGEEWSSRFKISFAFGEYGACVIVSDGHYDGPLIIYNRELAIREAELNDEEE